MITLWPSFWDLWVRQNISQGICAKANCFLLDHLLGVPLFTTGITGWGPNILTISFWMSPKEKLEHYSKRDTQISYLGKRELVAHSAPDLLTRIWIVTISPNESQHSIVGGKSLHSNVIDVLCQVSDCSWLATCLFLRCEVPGKTVRNPQIVHVKEILSKLFQVRIRLPFYIKGKLKEKKFLNPFSSQFSKSSNTTIPWCFWSSTWPLSCYLL